MLAFCWAHVRRKLLEAEAAYPQCAEALDLIGALYQVERGAPSVRGLSPAEAVQALQLRAQLRATQSQPILERLWAWTQEQVCLPRSSLRGALDYMRSLWPGLTRFVSDPRIPLDNNTAEREMRTVVRGGSFCTTPSGFCHHESILLLRRRDTTAFGTSLSVA